MSENVEKDNKLMENKENKVEKKSLYIDTNAMIDNFIDSEDREMVLFYFFNEVLAGIKGLFASFIEDKESYNILRQLVFEKVVEIKNQIKKLTFKYVSDKLKEME